MDFGNNHTGTGGWVLSILGMLIILGLILAAVRLLFSARRDPTGSVSTTGEPAGEILSRRLASGEVSAERYEQLRETLLLDVPPSTGRPRHRPPAGARV